MGWDVIPTNILQNDLINRSKSRQMPWIDGFVSHTEQCTQFWECPIGIMDLKDVLNPMEPEAGPAPGSTSKTGVSKDGEESKDMQQLGNTTFGRNQKVSQYLKKSSRHRIKSSWTFKSCSRSSHGSSYRRSTSEHDWKYVWNPNRYLGNGSRLVCK